MLDVTRGSVPYVTSSSTVAGAAYVGGDLPPKYHRHTIGVIKAIMSRVGHGPFASEFGGEKSEKYCMEDNGTKHNKQFERNNYNVSTLLKSDDPFEVGIALRILGNEYGTVTGRPRRIGMLDLVQLDYAIKMNGVDKLFINKCDLLKDFSKTKNHTIPLVVGYEIDGRQTKNMPISNQSYNSLTPIVENLPSFSEDISSINSVNELPIPLLQLLDRIKQYTSVDILGIGVGPSRKQYILF